MNDYLYIIRGGDDEFANLSPEEMQVHMQDWQKWMGGLAEEGKFVGGQPLKPEAMSIIGSSIKVVDRPLAEAKELVGGYLIMKANDLMEATELGKGCPGLEHNCTIEVREIRPM